MATSKYGYIYPFTLACDILLNITSVERGYDQYFGGYITPIFLHRGLCDPT